MRKFKFLTVLLLSLFLISCNKDEEYDILNSIEYRTFVYKDQTNQTQKFGVKILHPNIKIQDIKIQITLKNEQSFTSYDERDFSWRYSSREMEGITYTSHRNITFPVIRLLKIKISNHWYRIL